MSMCVKSVHNNQISRHAYTNSLVANTVILQPIRTVLYMYNNKNRAGIKLNLYCLQHI